MVDNPRYSMSVLSIWLGVTSILFCSTGILSLIFGGVAIVLAILSAPKNHKMLPSAKVGLVLGFAGIAISYVLLGSSMYVIFTNDTVRQAMQQYIDLVAALKNA